VSEKERSKFRLIAALALSQPLELVVELAVSDEELRLRGVPMSDRDWEEGLGDFSYSCLEIATGEQLFLQRLDGNPSGGLSVYSPLWSDARETTVRLLDVLDLSEDRVTWHVPADAWSQLQQRGREWVGRAEEAGD
jgi:hypothetical protein